MATEKRKRASDTTEVPNKRLALASDATIRVTTLLRGDELGPVIATAPGLSLPKNLKLRAYRKSKPSTASSPKHRELLLHSSTHPVLDYTARERRDSGAESLLKHYVGVFDPEKNELEVVEAAKMNINGSVRAEDEEMRKEKEKRNVAGLSLRQQLASEFGTKKAKKAVDEIIENAITPLNKQFDTPEEAQAALKANPTATAILNSMAASAKNTPDKTAIQAGMDESRPRPKVNPNAEFPREVYNIESIVGEDTIKLLRTNDWVAKVKADEAVRLPFQYIANRLVETVKSGEPQKLYALRYMFHLMRFNAATTGKKGGGKKLKDREKLETASGIPPVLLDSILQKFAEKGDMTKWHVDNLMTHIFALSLIVDDYQTDTYDLREDLRLKPKELAEYYHEIGVKLVLPTETQRHLMKISASERSSHKIATLKLPLDFPRVRTVPMRRK